MEWPSKNIPQGGVFQSAKIRYSPETQQFLKTLIQESKMTTQQRNRINYSLRSGKPLPPVESTESYTASVLRKKYPVTIRPGSSKRRSFETIMKSGAYERDKFKPHHPRVDREAVKQEFQDKMSLGKGVKPRPQKFSVKVKKKEAEPEINRYDQLKREIKEREEWLGEMEELGEGEKHRVVIHQQIEQRLREMEKLKIRDD